GMEAFARILHCGLSRVAISLSALDKRQAQLRNSFHRLTQHSSEAEQHVSSGLPLSQNTNHTQTDLQSRLHQIFASFFGVPFIAADDNFFEMGGDSLRALYLLRIVHKELGQKI